MAVANDGNHVLIDSGGVSQVGFFTENQASNIKRQDGGAITTITSNPIGSNANGQILLEKAENTFGNLDSNFTFVCQSMRIKDGVAGDDPIEGLRLSLRGAKVIMTGWTGVAEANAPIVGDEETTIVCRAAGTAWNSHHPGTYVDGSTFIFNSTGDAHLGRHPNATVRNPKLIWTSTSPNLFVLALNQGWEIDDPKPSPMDGFTFTSIRGNHLIAMFSMVTSTIAGRQSNNSFFVTRDWTYNVAPVGQQPTMLLRSHRRGNVWSNAEAYWPHGAFLTPTYLHIDLKTTLDEDGVVTNTPTYLRNIDYDAQGTLESHVAVDVVAYRFTPRAVTPLGDPLENCSISVVCTHPNMSSENDIGQMRARLVASGITNANGYIDIIEPEGFNKDYTSNASHRTDSFIHQNRHRAQAWHKWWEPNTKLIPICDGRTSTGAELTESYDADQFYVRYRLAGQRFVERPLNMSEPYINDVPFTVDDNYNSEASTTGISVSYAGGATTVNLTDGNHTLDGIWKAVIDYHATIEATEAETVFPFDSWQQGVMQFGSALRIEGSENAIIKAGEIIKRLESSVAESFNTTGNPFVRAAWEDINGYHPPWVTLTVRGFVDGSDVVIKDNNVFATGDGSNVLASGDAVNSPFVFEYSGEYTVNVALYKAGYVPAFYRGIELSDSNTVLNTAQTVDRVYRP